MTDTTRPKKRLRLGMLGSHCWGFSPLTSLLVGELSEHFELPFLWTDRPVQGGSNAEVRVWQHIDLWHALTHEDKQDVRQACARQVRHKALYEVEVVQRTYVRARRKDPKDKKSPIVRNDDELLENKIEEHELDGILVCIFGGIIDFYGKWLLNHSRIKGRAFNVHPFGWPMGRRRGIPLYVPEGFGGATGDVGTIDAIVNNQCNFASAGLHQLTHEIDGGRLFACSDPISIMMIPWEIRKVLTEDAAAQRQHMRSNMFLMALAGSVQLVCERSLPYLMGAVKRNNPPKRTRRVDELQPWEPYLRKKGKKKPA